MAYYAKQKPLELHDVNFELECIDYNKDLKNKHCYTREEDCITFFNGVGNVKSANIMFVTEQPCKEDLDDSTSTPCLLKSPEGLHFSKMCIQAGIDLDLEYFTTVKKYYSKSKKFKAKDKNYCYQLLEDEISYIKPKLIVCVGKTAMNRILGLNIGITKIEESFLYSEKYNCRVFVIADIFRAYYKPDYKDKLALELHMLSEYVNKWALNLPQQTIKQNYKLINSLHTLSAWVNECIQEYRTVFAVDCEWRGLNYKDGTLRSIQFCWAPGEAVYLDLYNESNEWVFDCDMDTVKNFLQIHLNNPDVKYIGHNFAADALWMKHHLGLEVENGKCIFDTMFALQVFNEYDDRKLEKCAAKYTDLGRYDAELILWKESNKGVAFDDFEGYGKVPLDILFPYACRDVDATLRLYPIFKKGLQDDNTYDYYMNIRHPFVTETYAQMMEIGIPLQKDDTELQRRVFILCTHILEKIFKDEMSREADTLLLQHALHADMDGMNVYTYFDNNVLGKDVTTLNVDNIFKDVKPFIKDKDKLIKLNRCFTHYIKCKTGTFNTKNNIDRVAWLYDVKGYTPTKTTKNEDGLSTLWSKILEKPAEVQKQYTPSVDKTSLKVYADAGDENVRLLLQLTAINKLAISFFSTKPDKGLLPYRCSDGFLRCLYSCTETGRPTSFKPNVLNIPKSLSNTILNAHKKVLIYLGATYDEDTKTWDYTHVNNDLYVQNLKEVESIYNINMVDTLPIEKLQPRSIRWSFKAPPGYSIVDADYVSAEVYAIAYLSNDVDLIKALTEKDIQFGFINGKEVRLRFDDSIVEFTQDVKDNYPLEIINSDDTRLDRDDNGNIIHPKRDIYWELVESKYYMNTPREILEQEYNGKGRDVYRTAGKIANFLITYGGTAGFLEAQISIVTGQKLPPGTGEKIIDAFKNTRKGCWRFKTECEALPATTHSYVSPSGYKRHFKVHDLNDYDISDKVRNDVLAPLQRQACNVGMQSLVADSLALSAYKLNTHLITAGIDARVFNPLYDALYVLARNDVVDTVKALMARYMSDETVWDLPGGTLKFKLDFEHTKRWTSAPTEEELIEMEVCTHIA